MWFYSGLAFRRRFILNAIPWLILNVCTGFVRNPVGMAPPRCGEGACRRPLGVSMTPEARAKAAEALRAAANNLAPDEADDHAPDDERRAFCSDDPCLLVPWQPQTRIYENAYSQIVIHQRDDGGEDSRVYISNEFLGELIGRLECFKEEIWRRKR